MAPDVNSMPSSPRREQSSTARLSPTHIESSTSPGNRLSSASREMPPPSQPASTSPIMSNPRGSATATGATTDLNLPLRHPRPLTATELYLECEKEQEAVVNRLTRELTALRAQSASVASNASHASSSNSASLLPVDITDPNPTHQIMGATHPTPSRRRGSSSVSSRSAQLGSAPSSHANPLPSTSMSGSMASTIPAGGRSQASAERAAAATGTNSISRQPSFGASDSSTPARRSLDNPRHGQDTNPGNRGTIYSLPHRPSLSRDQSYVSSSSTHAHAGTPFSLPHPAPAQPHNQTISSQQVSEMAAYRTEMEIVKSENEALRQRVRALERALRQRRRDSSQSDTAGSRSDPSNVNGAARVPRDRETFEQRPGHISPVMHPGPAGVAAWAAGDGGVGGVAGPRERSESQSTTASSRRGLVAEEDAVRFGESAGNAGISR